MIRVLHIVPGLIGGGVEKMLLNYYSEMDRSKYKFDFIVHGKDIGAFELIFENLGCNIYHVPSKGESIIENLKHINSIIKNGKYDVVHAHQGVSAVFSMYYSKKSDVKIRITHSHIAYEDKGIIRMGIDKLLLPLLKRYSTHWVACGVYAGKYLWGEKAVNEGKVIIINNAIDIKKFVFNASIRTRKREELGVKNKFVIGNVARMSYQKNHEFLINTFSNIHKVDKNTVLLLVGNGELERDVRKQVELLGLDNAVYFLGLRNDVDELLQAIDIFVLPSRYEGLPVSLVEAQATGLQVIVSDNVTKEIGVTELIEFVSLEEGVEYWAERILQSKKTCSRNNMTKELKDSGYDIIEEVKKLESIYSN